jgi:hypothetical protein
MTPDAKHTNRDQRSTDTTHSCPSSAPRSRLVDLIPLFLQLSALLANELANESQTLQPCTTVTSSSSITTAEASESGSPRLSDSEYNAMDFVHTMEGSSRSESYTISKDSGPPSTPKKERRWTFPLSSLIGPDPVEAPYEEPKPPMSPHVPPTPASAVPRYHRRAGPTREWYALLAGLLTRAVLEGYLLKGWNGTYAVETLLSLGLSDGCRGEKPSEKPSFFGLLEGEPPMVNELDPDGLPSVPEAGRILFGGGAMLKEEGQMAELTAEEEFTLEMRKRMTEVRCTYCVFQRHLIRLLVPLYTSRHPNFNRTPRNAVAKVRSRTR